MRKNAKYVSLSLLFFISFSASAIEVADGCTGNQPAIDKKIFNWRYYLNANPDLTLNGITTPSAACSHWLSLGINEGRQAHSGFHSLQYLARYPDVANYFGANNYNGAIAHYINNGQNEARIGYQENGISLGRNTTTVSNSFLGSMIYVGTSKRNAGAIDSLIFDNVEYINSLDRGRELQIASVSSWGEGYNPTEAGSCNNGFGGTTSAILNSINATGNNISTTNTPAFWNWPGQNYGCGIGKNTTKTAINHRFHKNITIGGISGMPGVIQFSTQIDINENVPQDPSSPNGPLMRFAIPTGYLAGEFNRIFRFNRTNKTVAEVSGLSCLTTIGCTSNDPLIYATNNLSHTIGVCTGGAAGAAFAPYEKYQAYGNLDSSSPIASTTKWAILRYVNGNIGAGTKLNFNSYISVNKSNNSANALENSRVAMSNLYQNGYCF